MREHHYEPVTTNMVNDGLQENSVRRKGKTTKSYMLVVAAIVCLAPTYASIKKLNVIISYRETSTARNKHDATNLTSGLLPNGTDLLSTLPLVDGIPRAVITHPCSGSSATLQFTTKILAAHGYDVLNAGKPTSKPRQRIMDIAKQRLEAKLDREPTHIELVAETIVYYNEEAIRQRKILVFKFGKSDDSIIETLKGLGTRFTYTYRRNLLDRAICLVKDCFVKGKLGDPVHVNGTKANTCFGRRKNSDEKVLAYFKDNAALFAEIRVWENDHKQHIHDNLYNSAKVIAYEDLFIFEYTDNKEVFKFSVKAWCAFLKNFGQIKEAVVEKVLRTYMNSRQPKPPVKELIYKFDEMGIRINQATGDISRNSSYTEITLR